MIEMLVVFVFAIVVLVIVFGILADKRHREIERGGE